MSLFGKKKEEKEKHRPAAVLAAAQRQAAKHHAVRRLARSKTSRCLVQGANPAMSSTRM